MVCLSPLSQVMLVDGGTGTAYKRRVQALMAERLQDQLREWRTEAGLDQEELAQLLGVRQQTISEWERGRARPHYARATAIDSAFGLPEGTVMAALQGQAAAGAPPPRDVQVAERLDRLQEQLDEVTGLLRDALAREDPERSDEERRRGRDRRAAG